MRIDAGDLTDPRILALLDAHVTRARAETARGSAHALDHRGLATPDITFFAAWDDERLLGVAALKRLSADHAEVKSMHTAEAARRTGVGSALLQHLFDAARAAGMTRLSLETGAWPYFAPARSFYQRHGFTECPPFGSYVQDPNSVFMTRTL